MMGVWLKDGWKAAGAGDSRSGQGRSWRGEKQGTETIRKEPKAVSEVSGRRRNQPKEGLRRKRPKGGAREAISRVKEWEIRPRASEPEIARLREGGKSRKF